MSRRVVFSVYILALITAIPDLNLANIIFAVLLYSIPPTFCSCYWLLWWRRMKTWMQSCCQAVLRMRYFQLRLQLRQQHLPVVTEQQAMGLQLPRNRYVQQNTRSDSSSPKQSHAHRHCCTPSQAAETLGVACWLSMDWAYTQVQLHSTIKLLIWPTVVALVL